LRFVFAGTCILSSGAFGTTSLPGIEIMKKPSNLFFNWKAMLATLLTLGALGGGVFLVHRQQMKSISNEYLQLAEKAKAKEDWREARTHLERYLIQHPDDAARRAEIAELFDKTAISPNEKRRAVAQYLTAIGLCESKEELKPTVPELRRKLAERQFSLGSYADAVDQIAVVAESDWDPKLVRLFALCRFRQVQNNLPDRWSVKAESEAPEWLKSLAQGHYIDLLEKALLQNPGDIELSEAFAISCTQSNTKFAGSSLADATKTELSAKAKSTLDKMLEAHIESSEAWVLHYAILMTFAPQSANETLEKALAKFPADRMVRRMAGEHYLRIASKMGRDDPKYLDLLSIAEENFKAALADLEKVDVVSARYLGDIQTQRGDLKGAVQIWKESLRSSAETIPLYSRIILNSIVLKEMDQAREYLLEMDKAIAQVSQERTSDPNSNASNAEEVKKQTRVSKELWARYHLNQNDQESAIPLLEFLVSTNTTESVANRAGILTLLAQAHMMSQQWDKAGTHFEQAADLIPNESAYHSGAATAWSNAGRFSQALIHLNSISNKSPLDWLTEAVVILNLQSSPSADPSLWQSFDIAIEALNRVVADPNASATIPATPEATGNDSGPTAKPWVITHIKIQGDVLRVSDASRPEAIQEATTKLNELCRSQPQNITLWRRTFDILRSWKQLDTLNLLIEEFRTTHPESEEASQAKVGQLAKEGKLSEARQALLAGITDATEPNATLLAIRRVLILCENQTQWLEAFDALLKWSDKSLARSKHVADAALSVVNLRGETDIQTDAKNTSELGIRRIHLWSDAVQKIEMQVKGMEGDQGTEWKAILAQRLLNVAEFDPNLELQPIIEVTRNLESQRPLWATTHVIAGRLAQRLGDLDGAVKSFNRAISLGEKEIRVFEQLGLLLFQQGMYADAKKIIDQLGAAAGSSKELSSLAMRLPGSTQTDLLDLAQAGIDARPIDPMAWIWLGQILESTSRTAPSAERKEKLAKATEAFEKAAQLNSIGDARAFSAEYSFYALLKDQDRLEDLLVRLEASKKINDSTRCLLMAKVEQVLGKYSEAEANFKKAIEYGGDRIEIGVMLGKHYLLSGKGDLAVEQFEKLYRDYPKEFSIRKSMVSLLQMRGAAEDWARINSILLDPKNANGVEDRRYLSELHFQRGTFADLEKAKGLLDDIVIDPTLRTNGDSFLLARTCERLAKEGGKKMVNDRERLKLNQLAAKHFRLATESSEPDPVYIKAYGDFLIESKQFDEAIGQANELKAIAPNEFITALLDAKIKQAQGQSKEAIDTVLKWQSDSLSNLEPDSLPQRSQLILVSTITGLLGIGAIEEADQRIDELMQSNPEAAIECLVYCGKLNDLKSRSYALARLVDHTQRQPTDDGFMRLVRMLADNDFEPESRGKAEAMLMERDSQNTTNASVHMLIGDLWLKRANIPQAIQSYRHTIAIEPNHLMALNNLACLIAESTGKTEESIVFIDQALQIAGNNPDLLDSKGVILMQDGKYAEAAELFEAATAKGADPRFVFHWYIALLKAGRLADAARLRTKIDVEALRSKHLSPDDLKELEKLNAASL
jgi:tetratricopeptide (TPR) repeat protein